jgi:hypothetical protein
MVAVQACEVGNKYEYVMGLSPTLGSDVRWPSITGALCTVFHFLYVENLIEVYNLSKDQD